MLPWADISLVKCWICSSCFSMKTSQNCLWSCCQHGFLRISPGSCWGADSAVPLPWGPGGLCCHLLALQWPGGTNFRLCLCTLGYSCWHSRLHSPKASRVSKLWDYISHFLFSPHKVINERISAVNSLGCFIIYFHFFTIHLSITWNFHWNQQDLQYPFFLLGNTVYSDHPILLPLPGDLAEWMLMK